MRKLLIVLGTCLAFASSALADWTGKDASSATITFKNASGACSSVVCVPQAAITDSTGVNFATVSGGNLGVAATQAGTWNITNISGTISLPTGAATAAGLTTINTTLGSPFQAAGALGAGSAIIGKVGIDQTTPGTTNLVNSKNCDTSTATQCASVKAASTNAAATDLALVADPRPNSAATLSGTTTNPSATLTLPATTTAYTAGQLIANSATAGSVVNPSFAIFNSAGGAVITRLRLSTNDATSTAWGAQTIQVDLWTTTPTWTNGDRGTWSPATGTGAHLGSFTCTMSAEYGDGAFGECSSTIGNFVGVKLGSGTSVFWSLKAVSGSGVTGVSKVFTLVAEVLN